MNTILFRLLILCIFAICCYPAQAFANNKPINLSLETAVERALLLNLNLKSNTFDLDGNRINLEAAKSGFDIKITPLSSINYSSAAEDEEAIWRVGGQIRKKIINGIAVSLAPSVEKENDYYSAGVGFSLAIPLLRGLGKEVTLDGIYAQEHALDSSHRTLHRQQVNTILSTVSAVYALLQEQDLVSLYEDQLNVLKGHLRNIIIKEQVGISNSMDVYRAEIRIKEVEDSLNVAMERGADTSDRLKEIVVLPFNQPIYITAPQEYTIITMQLEEAVQVALSNRIEIDQAEADIIEAKRKERVAKHNTLPDLKLEAAYTRKGDAENFENLFGFNEDIWSIGLTSSTDLTRTTEKAAWMQSRLAVNRRNLDLDILQKNIVREVRTVLNSLEKSKERIELQRQQIFKATGKLRLAHIKFQYKEADNFDIIESQAQLEQAKINLISHEMQYIIDGYRLRASMGTLIANKPTGNQ